MNIYTATFSGMWLGGDALIIAPTVADARAMLDTELAARLLTDKQRDRPDITWHATAGLGTSPKIVILDDGNY